MRRELISGFFIALALGCVVALATEYPAPVPQTNPLPEPNFAGLPLPPTVLPPTPCSAENSYEARLYAAQGWTQTDGNGTLVHYAQLPGTTDSTHNFGCQRLHFKFGPILVKPGQNDVLIEPITIEKPAYDGYVVRFKPDLIWADPGNPGKFDVPPIQMVHLHHGTWLSLINNYGNSAFAASGEEKTIEDAPVYPSAGAANAAFYGFPIGATDTWQLLYMIHNLTSSTYTTWITYDTDFVPKAAGDALHIRPVYPIWLDVRSGAAYPVMNIQRSSAAPLAFGPGSTFPLASELIPALTPLPNSNSTQCSWPIDHCAAFDPWGRADSSDPNNAVNPNQDNPGVPASSLGTGNDAARLPSSGGSLGRITNFTGGSLVWIGGHLHPGGLTDDIDLVRGTASVPIFRSQAQYWDYTDPSKVTTDNTKFDSWDVSMTVTGLPFWAVKVKPGDIIRINASYDNSIQDTYEDMGIAIALLAPDTSSYTNPGLDPFTATPNISTTSTDLTSFSSCGPNNNSTTLCEHGFVTHGSLPEAQFHSAPSGSFPSGLTLAPATNQVLIAAFQYAPGNVGFSGQIQTVNLGDTLTFTNLDAAADIYHTITACAYPCTGITGTAFPIANGKASNGAAVDFDSGELGYGPSATTPFFGQFGLGPAKNTLTWGLFIDPNIFKPCVIYTYFCRIHPMMRGAFMVVDPAAPSSCAAP